MNIGIIGAGAIATYLLKEINQKTVADKQIVSLLVRNKEKYLDLEKQFHITLFEDADAFLQSGVDVVVEAATIEAVRSLAPKILSQKDMIVISIGAFADSDFYHDILQTAVENNRHIHLPSGAIGGLDLLQNAYVSSGISKVTLTTRKPAHSLVEKEIKSAEKVFEGNAEQAIKQFPKNINVSIILSIAGIGVKQTNVTIIADPAIQNNMHTIEIEGEFGKANFTIQNNPFAENPKTSYLAAMSVLGTLNRMTNNIKIGH